MSNLMNEKPGDFSGPRAQVHRTPGLRSLTTPWVIVDEDQWEEAVPLLGGTLGTYSVLQAVWRGGEESDRQMGG